MRGHFPKHSASPVAAQSRFRRAKYVFSHFKTMMEKWPAEFERTQSRHIGTTYGLDTETVKRIKARFRNELSFGGEGK